MVCACALRSLCLSQVLVECDAGDGSVKVLQASSSLMTVKLRSFGNRRMTSSVGFLRPSSYAHIVCSSSFRDSTRFVSPLPVPPPCSSRFSSSSSSSSSTVEEKSTENSVSESTSASIPAQNTLSKHDFDPHEPNWSPLLPEPMRPYPAFEGWFTRIWDPCSNFSAAVIMATNYATNESQVTLLFTPCVEDLGRSNSSPYNAKYELRTYAVAEMSKDAKFSTIPNKNVDGECKPVTTEPAGFLWQSTGMGMINATAHETVIDVTIKGYTFKTRLTKEVLWDGNHSDRGPEGWAKDLPVPTHWYVYSLGSTAEYEFSGPEGALVKKGSGWGHLEKNWGQTFPNGHVWFQGFSADNSSQLIGSAAYYTACSLKLPYLITLGYRSPAVKIDMRTNDLGTVFEQIEICPLSGEFSVKGISSSHTILIKAMADPKTFSEPILAPMGKVHWDSACRETFLAELKVEVYEHAVWGVASEDKLVEQRSFNYAGLEFGEDLLKEATQKQEDELNNQQIERSRAVDI